MFDNIVTHRYNIIKHSPTIYFLKHRPFEINIIYTGFCDYTAYLLDLFFLWRHNYPLYEEVITHAFNEAVRWQLRNNPSFVELCCKLVFSSIRAFKSTSKAKRKQMIADYFSEFMNASPKVISFSGTAWRVIIERADITRDRQMILQFIDGSEYVYIIPKYSPIHRKHLLK